MDKRKKITNVFMNAARSYQDEGKSHAFEIVQGHDVHAFLQMPYNLVIHVQGYPGMSGLKEMYVSTRLRNYSKMLKERLAGASIGNEHESNIPLISSDSILTKMPYNERKLKDFLDNTFKAAEKLDIKAS